MENFKKIGGFAGKFLPPHKGHIAQIEESAKMCDKLFVVVADKEENSRRLCKEADIPYISAEMRVAWLKEHFKNESKIEVIYMNESGLKSFPDGLEEWSKAFKELTNYQINMKFADETYRELNEKYFPECEFVCFDRKVINISATQVRNEPEKYFNYIIDEAKPFFEEILKNS